MNDETKTQIVPDEVVMSKIHLIRGQKVMLDYDLAELYEIENKVLKQSVKRNMDRFPPDFLFELTFDEYHSLRSQFVTLEKGRGKHSKYLTFAFSEQGIAMLSSILNSSKGHTDEYCHHQNICLYPAIRVNKQRPDRKIERTGNQV